MRHVPAQFKLMGRDYTVIVLTPKEADEGDMQGEHSINDGTIAIDTRISKQGQFATFGHELMHALFECAGRDDLSSDERLVEIMGQLLHQFLKTHKGRFDAPTKGRFDK